MSKAALEKRYGVKIVWDHWNDEYVIYSADGCKWENGTPTIKACANECVDWMDALLSIKRTVENKRLH